jgi:hypothetical protein
MLTAAEKHFHANSIRHVFRMLEFGHGHAQAHVFLGVTLWMCGVVVVSEQSVSSSCSARLFLQSG